MKRVVIIVFILIVGQQLFAKEFNFKFNSKGEFKIIQFTDTHVKVGADNQQHVLDMVDLLLKEESPDLVVFTGDVVVDSDNPLPCYKMFDNFFKKCNQPWAIVLGNHDAENEMSRDDVSTLVAELEYCIAVVDDGIGGVNYTKEIMSSDGESIASVLYFMDSQSYSQLKPKVDGYGWFSHSQVEWYIEQSCHYREICSDSVIPSLAFFHIPLPEYVDGWNRGVVFGTKKEDVCCPKINSGMFAAMVEQGDVMGTFVGHDHINDYIASYYNIALAYGRSSGASNTYGNMIQGGRIIVMKEGQRTFDTWIREKSGEVVLKCNFPDSFKK